MTHVTTAVKDDADDLALLYLGQVELCQSFAGVQIVLRHQTLRSPRTARTPRTSLLINTTKTLRRISVFMPCFRASFTSAVLPTSSASTSFCFVEAACCWSTRGSPPHAAPTSHHLPFVSAARRSPNDTRSASCACTSNTFASLEGELGGVWLTVTLLAKARQELLHTFDGIASLMLSRTFLVLVVLEIGERLDHKLGTRTGGASSMGDGRR